MLNSSPADLAQHYLMKANITAIRRLRKTDNNRIARATGATIVNRTDEIKESDVGTGAGLFEIKKVGDEFVNIFGCLFILTDAQLLHLHHGVQEPQGMHSPAPRS